MDITLEIIKVLASMAMAVIAYLALRNWKHQEKAKRKAEFLDALIEAAHSYISVINIPITLIQFAKIGMESHVPPGEDSERESSALKGAIAYIQKRGKDDAEALSLQLNAVRPLAIKLHSLVAKGQVFKFVNYEKCWNATIRLAWQFSRMEAFSFFICSDTLNWENPDVLQRFRDVMKLDPDEIRNNVQDDNAALLEFSKDTYQQIYG